MGAGAVKAKLCASGGNSNFSFAVLALDFFSDFCPAAIARQSGQRCFPSKVWETASVTDSPWRLPASIAVQATVCSAAQCRPVERTRARITKIFPNRASTETSSRKTVKNQGKTRTDRLNQLPVGAVDCNCARSCSDAGLPAGEFIIGKAPRHFQYSTWPSAKARVSPFACRQAGIFSHWLPAAA